MTRFLLDVDDAVDLIMKSPSYAGCNLIPMAKSFRVKDLFDIYGEEFGLKYRVTEPRTGEKIHEIMASNEEVRRMELIEDDSIYLLHPQKDMHQVSFKNQEYSSRDHCLTKKELYDYLKSKNFYKQ
jgi:UDP-glucose 4-epimerase